MEWYNLFRPHILDRGAEYHQDGYVSVFNRTETGIEAEVKGTEVYHVEIEITELTWEERIAKKRENAIELVKKIPEEECEIYWSVL